MRKINFLTTVLGVAAAMLISASAFGQVANNDYVEFNADQTNGTTHNDSIDYVTVNSTLGYYAMPDPVYHPNYSATASPAWQLTADFTWVWTVPTGVTIDATPSLPTPPANYVELVYATEGSYEISVAETAPTALGGCDGIPTYLYVNVIGLPTGTEAIVPADLTHAGTTDWQEISEGTSYQICGAQAAQQIAVNFVEAVPIYYASYSFQITQEIDLLNGAGDVIAGDDGTGNGAETVYQNYPLGAGNQLSNRTDGTGIGTFSQTSAGHFTFTFLSGALNIGSVNVSSVSTTYRTRYTYRLRTADNVAPYTEVSTGNSFVSNILAKSDYLATTKRSVDFTNYEVSFIVNPAPVTGPIYHISNTYSF